jgi:Helix-turn-helix domain
MLRSPVHPFGRFAMLTGTRMLAYPAAWEVHMPLVEGPLLHRRGLGLRLRRLRGARSLDEVTAATLISTSKLSRLENGRGVPQPREIRDLVAYYEFVAPSGPQPSARQTVKRLTRDARG